MKKHLYQGAAVVALTCALAQGASAQSASAARPADTTGAGGLETVVVTATKRETNLQRTPISMSVVSPLIMQDRHITSILDLGDGTIPGLRVATFEARQSALTIGIRGIVPLDANQPAREQGVGVYIDGVYLGRQQGLNSTLLDIERLEVLKGPQGTLFGRNTEGGALSIVTRKPTGQFGLRTNFGVGNYGIYNGEIHLDLPAIFDISQKFDVVTQHQSATTKNLLPSAYGWNYFDRQGIRYSASFNQGGTFTADFTADYAHDQNTPFYSQLLNYNPEGRVVGPASGTLPAGQIRPLPAIVQVQGVNRMAVADIGVPQNASLDETWGWGLRASWHVLENLELRSITSQRGVFTDQWDNAGGAHRLPVYSPSTAFSRYSLSQLWQHQLSQEFQAVGNLWDQVDYVGGLYYYTEYAREEAATPSSNTWSATGIPTATSLGYTINDPTPTIPGFRSLDRASNAKSKSMAVYGQATWTPQIFDNMFHLTVGGRWTHDDKQGTLYKVSNAVSNLGFTQKNNRFNPMVTLAVDLAPDINVYAKYASGYRAGGASSRSLTFRSFGPEDVDSFEMGAKTEFFDNRLRLNGAIYTMDRTGSQIDFSMVTVVGAATRNTLEAINAPGTTKISGMELEANLSVTPEIKLNASYAYTFTKIPPTINPFNNIVQPVYIVFTPQNVASAGIDWDHDLGYAAIRAHVDGAYADATQSFDNWAIKNDASFIMNGSIGLAEIAAGNNGAATMGFQFWIRNMWDVAYVYRRDPSNAATLGNYGNFNAPRTFGVSANINF